MAINPISLPSRQPKKDALDKVLQGLQIAEAAFKIPVNYQQYKAYAAEAGMKEDERAGITTRAKIGGAGGVIVPAQSGDGGAGLTPRYGAPLIPMKVREGDDVVDVQVANPEADRKFFEDERKLRGEYEGHKVTKDTTEMLRSAQAALDIVAKKQHLGSDDVALIFKFIQTVEPGSFVREGEAQLAQRAAGLRSQLTNMLDRLKTGTLFDATARRNMERTIGSLVSTQMDLQDKIDGTYGRMAEEQKFKVPNVVTGFWTAEDSPVKAVRTKRGEAKSAPAEKASPPVKKAEAPKYKPGEERNVGGVVYVRDSKGQWNPK